MNEFKSLLDNTVKKQQISDVKLGAFLSGGIDSSTIVASMCNTKQKNRQCFCVGFKEENYSEVEQSKYLSKFFNIKNYSLNIGSEIQSF